MHNKLTLEQIDVAQKRVFCRVDFNVPLDGDQITDDTRVRAALPTIRFLRDQGAKLILASHLGRPKGKVNPDFSLKPVARHLQGLLDCPVTMAPDCIGSATEELIAAMKPGDVLLLENVRFHAGETDNDPDFAAQLAALADVYVNDAFGTAHRAHASTEGVARLLRPAAAGSLMQKELTYLGRSLADPQRPFLAILGGAKVSDKITVIENLLPKVDTILIGGGMAYTFLRAQGISVGTSLVENDCIELAGALLKKAAEHNVDFLLPEDHAVATEFSDASPMHLCTNKNFPDAMMGLDIGPDTIATYSQRVAAAKTVLWNGPMGVFEFATYARGTFAVAEALADSEALSIIGGGDSVAAVNKAGLQDKMTHISTGGGASLEFLEGKQLPGVVALSDA
ncbi:MAG: phosphoglycerate kinase [Desulfuromonas sp.]|nr:MAG: phosphoglycerate kinase [Desulfuromonas sp.]